MWNSTSSQTISQVWMEAMAFADVSGKVLKYSSKACLRRQQVCSHVTTGLALRELPFQLVTRRDKLISKEG